MLCSRLAQHSHRQGLHIFPRPGYFATHFRLQIHPQLFHSSPIILNLRKAPQSRNKILGINVTYLPWASQFLRQWIRKKGIMFGVKTDKERNKIVQRIAIFYAVFAWTMLGYMIFWMKDKYTDKDEKKGVPYEEEVARGGALWWIANSGRTDIKDDDDIYVWKVKGFKIEKEHITHKAKAVTEAMRMKADAESDDLVMRRMLGLPLVREEGKSDEERKEELKAALEALGKDYELEMDLVKQQSRRKEMEDRTDEELRALGTIEGKIKLFARHLRRKIKGKIVSDESGSKTKDTQSEDIISDETESKTKDPESDPS